MKNILFALSPAFFLLSACQTDTSVIEDRLAQLENDSAQAKAQIVALQSALDACATSKDLSGYATHAWVEKQGYTTELELADYATHADLADYATIAALGDYATTEYVDEQNAAQDAASYATYATTEDVAAADSLLAASVATNYATASTVNAQDDALSSRISAIEADYVVAAGIEGAVRLVDEDTTVDVSTSGGLREALSDLDGLLIASGVTYTINLAAGVYTFEEPLHLRHPDGGRLHIEGAGVGETTFIFSASDGVVVDEGSDVGFLGGLTIQGLGLATTNGVTVSESSAMTLGDVEVTSFGNYGILVSGNATLDSDGIVEVSDCSTGVAVIESGFANLSGALSRGNDDDGFYANNGSILASGTVSTGNGGDGFWAANLSYIGADSSQSTANGQRGFYSLYGSFMDANGSISGTVSDPNGSYGYLAGRGASITASQAEAIGNGGIGYLAEHFAFIYAQESAASDNAGSYRTVYNSYIQAIGASADSTPTTGGNDTTDYIYGL